MSVFVPQAPAAHSFPARSRAISRSSAPAAPRQITTFWLCLWLAITLIATKAFQLGLPALSFGGVLRFLRDLAIVSYSDAIFAFTLCAAGELLLMLARPNWLRWPLWSLAAAFCTVCTIYSVINVYIYRVMGAPLTCRLLYMAGAAKGFRSSINAFITPARIVSILIVPVIYLAVLAVTHRLARHRPKQFHLKHILLLLAALAVALLTRQSVADSWTNRDEKRLVENPQWALLSSYAPMSIDARKIKVDATFPEEYAREVATVAERPHLAIPATALQNARPKNVIVVVLESVAIKYMSLYGSKYATTPVLQSEARNAAVFDNFYSHVGNTANSLIGVSLSTYPGMTWKKYPREQPGLRGVTVAEALKPHGYRSAFLTSADNEYDEMNNFLAGRGFDDIWDYRQLSSGEPLTSWGCDDKYLFDGMFKWIEQDKSKPFFILSWTCQTHHPYEPSVGMKQINFFDGDKPNDAYDLGRYLTVLHNVDEQLGRLFTYLREHNLADDTLVVITGDHGEAFGDPRPTSWGHSGKPYDEDLHVPCMIWNPRLFPAPRRMENVGGHVDLSPTIADILGVQPAPTWQGYS
ncbi:MAG TPA: LTA synthase family protein, partial [Tepidisphaeraceae bacterium]